MPLFLCPKCGKQYLVPLAIYESFLDDTPMTTPEGSTESVFVLPCSDCPPYKIPVVEGDRMGNE